MKGKNNHFFNFVQSHQIRRENWSGKCAGKPSTFAQIAADSTSAKIIRKANLKSVHVVDKTIHRNTRWVLNWNSFVAVYARCYWVFILNSNTTVSTNKFFFSVCIIPDGNWRRSNGWCMLRELRNWREKRNRRKIQIKLLLW